MNKYEAEANPERGNVAGSHRMRYIAYYRVSTMGQSQSGLGLEAQRSAVAAYVKSDPGDSKPALSALNPVVGENGIIAEFGDIESGKKDDRPEFHKAMATAKTKGAVLVIAKLDRLSHNLTFISSLIDAGVRFVCCDMPEANEFTIHIFAALAQQERKMISKRTIDALEAKRKQGVQLGKPENLSYEHRLKGAQVFSDQAKEDIRNKQATKLIQRYRKEKMTFEQIAIELNNEGYRTRRGKLFMAMSVKRLFDRNTVL